VAVGLDEALLLAVEQRIERRARDPRRADDLGDGGRLVAALGDDLGDRLEQPGPLAVGDEVITAAEWAARLDTIAYEIVCGIGPRVPRTYRR